MNTTTKPSNHTIDATLEQCSFLTRLAEANRRYRQALVSLKESCERELKANASWGLSSQTLNEVQKYHGALDVLSGLIWSVFTAPVGDDEERLAYIQKVNGWVNLALEDNDHGMSGQNWFFPVKK